MDTVKSGSVNSFQSTGIDSKATSKSTGKLQTPKIKMASGFGKSKIVK